MTDGAKSATDQPNPTETGHKAITLREQIAIDLRRNARVNIHDLERLFPNAQKQFKEERENMKRRGLLLKPAWMEEGGRRGDYVLGDPKHVIRTADNARRRVPRLARMAFKLHKYLQNNPDLTEGEKIALEEAAERMKSGLEVIERLYYNHRSRKEIVDGR